MGQDYRQLSYWHDSLPGLQLDRPALDSDIEVEIAIIGAGYTGLWTAYYLKQIDPTLSIVVLEAEIAGFGASGRNGGWCSSHLSGIDRWLDDPHQRSGALRLQRLMFETVAEIGLVRKTLLRFFPDLKGISFSHAWGGVMGVSRSMQPSVNFDPARRMGWAGGYFGSGVAATHLAGQTLADLVTSRDTERVHTPWVNPPHASRNWEPEPLRWLGVRSARALMTLADRAEYRFGKLGAGIGRTLDRVLP